MSHEVRKPLTVKTTKILAMKCDRLGLEEPEAKAVRDGFVVGKGDHWCAMCGGPIPPKTEHRARVKRVGGQLTTFRFCWTCCLAMALASLNPSMLGDRMSLGAMRLWPGKNPGAPTDHLSPEALQEFKGHNRWQNSPPVGARI